MESSHLWHGNRVVLTHHYNARSRTLQALVAALLFLSSAPLSAQEHKPHPYPPILQPILSTPEFVKLTPDELKSLSEDRPVVRQDKDGEAGSGIAIQYINAPAKYVWNVILSHHRYAEWVRNIDRCEVYKKDGRLWYIDMLTSFLWVKSQLYMVHRIQRPMGYISWSLDRTRTSDLKDVTGYWRIAPIDGQSHQTRLEYSSQIVAGGVPDFVVEFLTRDSLIDGTRWVKRQAEAAWAKARSPQD